MLDVKRDSYGERQYVMTSAAKWQLALDNETSAENVFDTIKFKQICY